MLSPLYLGHVVSGEGHAPDPVQAEVICASPPPQIKTHVRAFLDMAGYYHTHIKDYAKISRPLIALTEDEAVENVKWNPSCQHAFDQLKQFLTTGPVLKSPNYSLEFKLQTDWQLQAVAAILSQVEEGEEHPVAFASKQLTKGQRNWSASEVECYAVVWAMKKFRPYLCCNHFSLETDHQALKYLMTTSDLTEKLARWSLRLQEYDFEIKHRPGSANTNADGLSITTSPGQDNYCLKICDPDPPPGWELAEEGIDPRSNLLMLQQSGTEEHSLLSNGDRQEPRNSSRATSPKHCS